VKIFDSFVLFKSFKKVLNHNFDVYQMYKKPLKSTKNKKKKTLNNLNFLISFLPYIHQTERLD